MKNRKLLIKSLAESYRVVKTLHTCFRAVQKEKDLPLLLERFLYDCQVKFGFVHKLSDSRTQVFAARLGTLASDKAK